MSKLKTKLIASLVVLVATLIGGSLLIYKFYPYLFAKTISGKIVKVEKVSPDTAILTGQAVSTTGLFSFAIAIQTDDGQIHTASSEDRQWAVVQTGQCAQAKYFPYPPWVLDKAGTYYGARLLTLSPCK